MRRANVPAGLDHMTVRCSVAELASMSAFYCGVLQLEPGPRPNFDFPGHWLYTNGKAVVHLAAIVPDAPIQATAALAMSRTEPGTGLDHVSFRAVDLHEVRARLGALGVPFEELPVPGWPLHQIFLYDPAGTKIELTFELEP